MVKVQLKKQDLDSELQTKKGKATRKDSPKW